MQGKFEKNIIMEEIIKNFINEEIKKYNLQDNLTRYLVNKKKRGTYQAFNESGDLSEKIKESVATYIKDWIINSLISGEFKSKLDSEIKNAISLELSREGYAEVLKNLD
jgi:hypothetical protein